MKKTATLGDYRRFIAEYRDTIICHEVDCTMLGSFYTALAEENRPSEVDDLPDDHILGEKSHFIFDTIKASLSFSGQL